MQLITQILIIRYTINTLLKMKNEYQKDGHFVFLPRALRENRSYANEIKTEVNLNYVWL
jgi:hypothetical protein